MTNYFLLFSLTLYIAVLNGFPGFYKPSQFAAGVWAACALFCLTKAVTIWLN